MLGQGVEDQHDLWPWPTDLNINRDHLLIKDYLPTKFEACGAKRSWVISCTTCGRPTWLLTLTFDLLSLISKGITYLSRTIYIPSLKLLGQSVPELPVVQGVGDQHDLWPWPTDLNVKMDHLLIKDYIPAKFEASVVKLSWVVWGKAFCISCQRPTYLWPVDLNINRDHIYLQSLKLLW